MSSMDTSGYTALIEDIPVGDIKRIAGLITTMTDISIAERRCQIDEWEGLTDQQIQERRAIAYRSAPDKVTAETALQILGDHPWQNFYPMRFKFVGKHGGKAALFADGGTAIWSDVAVRFVQHILANHAPAGKTARIGCHYSHDEETGGRGTVVTPTHQFVMDTVVFMEDTERAISAAPGCVDGAALGRTLVDAAAAGARGDRDAELEALRATVLGLATHGLPPNLFGALNEPGVASTIRAALIARGEPLGVWDKEIELAVLESAPRSGDDHTGGMAPGRG
ncbi:hypothetical protein [Alcanivorax sp. 1008]|uniref:hypothetical protein n=1 Tax=Alcanivorax sp. 1008 TaxID=2816853 RepID=UPI001D42CA50|nr:hypothetical protein [Alcanivorax sp. 1008]MCC1496879.1 hypothetical protein [Alcanivorax sp. 1008]